MKKIFLTIAAMCGFFNVQLANATCDILSSFTDGQVLTASQLNTLVTGAENCSNAILDGDNFTGNVNLYSGADLSIYSDAGTTLTGTVDAATGGAILGLKAVGIPINLNIVNATTTNANDSIKIECGDATCSATNPGFIWIDSSTAGDRTLFKITSDVTINLTGAHWGFGGRGDTVDSILRVSAVNAAGSIVWCVGLQGRTAQRYIGSATLDSTTATDINLPEELLCNAAIAADDPINEIGYFKANFDDTGGAAEDLWAVQTGDGDILTGKSADGLWQTWIPGYIGFSVDPTGTHRWTQIGNQIIFTTEQSTGTSNGTGFVMTAPIKAESQMRNAIAVYTDNGTDVYGLGAVRIEAGSTTMDLATSTGEAGWTGSGNKRAFFAITYEAYLP
jgi:hypothetical protein